MKTSTKTNIISGAGYLIAAGTPVAMTASQFPVWVQSSSEKQFSGGFLLACFICAILLIALLWRKRSELKKYMSFAPLIICLTFAGILSQIEPIIHDLQAILYVSSIGEGVALVLFTVSAIMTKRAEGKGKEAMQMLADKLGGTK